MKKMITSKEIKDAKLCIICLNKGYFYHIYLKSTPTYLKRLLLGFRINEPFYLCKNCEKGDITTIIKIEKKVSH